MSQAPTPSAELGEALIWSDQLHVGWAPMDDVHEEFVQLLCNLQRGTDQELAGLLAAWIEHAQSHFAQEDQWMEETSFPPRQCHMEQHQAVLASAHEVQQLLEQGDVATCRRFAQALVTWFPEHTDHLDSALGHWMFKRRFGGKPLVMRSHVVPSASPT